MLSHSESRQMDVCPAEACEEARHFLTHAGAFIEISYPETPIAFNLGLILKCLKL